MIALSSLYVIYIILCISVLLLSMIIIFFSKQGKLGIRLKKHCETKSLPEIFVVLFLISGLIMVIIELLVEIISYFVMSFKIEYLSFDSNWFDNQFKYYIEINVAMPNILEDLLLLKFLRKSFCVGILALES